MERRGISASSEKKRSEKDEKEWPLLKRVEKGVLENGRFQEPLLRTPVIPLTAAGIGSFRFS